MYPLDIATEYFDLKCRMYDCWVFWHCTRVDSIRLLLSILLNIWPYWYLNRTIRWLAPIIFTTQLLLLTQKESVYWEAIINISTIWNTRRVFISKINGTIIDLWNNSDWEQRNSVNRVIGWVDETFSGAHFYSTIINKVYEPFFRIIGVSNSVRNSLRRNLTKKENFDTRNIFVSLGIDQNFGVWALYGKSKGLMVLEICFLIEIIREIWFSWMMKTLR